MLAKNIDEVVDRLDDVVAYCRRREDPAGLFASLYRQVTLRVRDECRYGRRFEDPARMEHFDTVFANRYLEAWEAWRGGSPGQLTEAWRVATLATTRRDLMLIQHLLLGINAHINLDLAIAAEQSCVTLGQPVEALGRDFDAINSILIELLDPVQRVLDRHSAAMAAVDWYGGTSDELLGVFSLKVMRQKAWAKAEALHRVSAHERPALVSSMDLDATKLANKVVDPPGLGWVQLLLRQGEPDRIGVVLDELDAVAAAR